jgi:hypothetical protein
MPNKASIQENFEQLSELKADIKIIANDVKTLKDNHLHHVDLRLVKVEKTLWWGFATLVANLVTLIFLLVQTMVA